MTSKELKAQRFTMYESIARNARAAGEIAVAEWAEQERDRNKLDILDLFDGIFKAVPE